MIINTNYTMLDNINDIQLRLIECGHAKSKEEWVGNIVSPPYTRLYYIVAGDPYIMLGDTRIPLEVGFCYLIPTGFSFRYACETSMEQLFFHVNLTDYNGTDLFRSCKNIMQYKLGTEKIADLIRYSESENLYDGLMLRQEIYSTILTMVDKYRVNLESVCFSRCVLLAIEYIKTHLSLQLGIGELAASAFVSESTLAKKFKSEVGMTIGSYIDDAILFEAEQLLLKSDLTILQISERFGFCDQFYFSRRFKMKYGETPQKYRKLRLI
ncbi:MAG: helix-turn-helix transcriptional regulator [Ruminococcaceae bacterium]|nr:helix-turn-helix transcriptional regulator [Oscillospiraceae bacterium]